MSLTVTSTAINFDNIHRAVQQVTVTGGLPPYSASSSNTNVATVAQATSPNLYPNSDTLSDSTLFGLAKASGGPGGATDAEYTGTGSAVGSNPDLAHNISVTMGQTYTPSFWIDPSQVTNIGSNVVSVAIGTIDGLTTILQKYVTSSTAGRYATSAWTCPTNLVAHSDDFSGWDMTYAGTGTIVSDAYSVPGTGAALNDYIISPFIGVSAGESVTLSASINASQCSSSAPIWSIYDTTGKTPGTGTLSTRLFVLSQSLGESGRISGSYQIPAGVTQIAVVPYTNNCVVPSGQSVTFSQAMLTTSGATYYISSQNPQVAVFAQLLSSAIVTSGQKFKISQPMLALSTYDPQTYIAQTAVWNITPRNGGAATITYTDSTP